MLIVCVDILVCGCYVHAMGATRIPWIDVWYNTHLCSLASVVLMVFLCANTGLFGVAIKGWNVSWWLISSALVIAVAVGGVAPAKDTSVLNRDQTSEWRGWMQCSFLIYHYLGAGQAPMPLYIWIRMMVGGFMFMTGFGHTSYFLIKANYSTKRIWQVLSRLNLLQFLLCCLLSKPWIFYYFTPLATVWFGCIYLTMAIYSSFNGNLMFVCIKIVVLMLCIELVLWLGCQNVLFQGLFMNPLTKVLFELGNDDGFFWYGRFAMDRFSVPCGMCFAVFLHKIRSFNGGGGSGVGGTAGTAGIAGIAVTADTGENAGAAAAAAAVFPARYGPNEIYGLYSIKWMLFFYGPAVLFVYGLYSYHAAVLLQGNKKMAISIHTICSPFVVVAFVAVRNHPWFGLDKYVSTTLVWIGSFSLELFIFQYHLLLVVPNEVSLGPAATLQLIPGQPEISAVLATLLLFSVSYCFSKVTTQLLRGIDFDGVLHWLRGKTNDSPKVSV